MDAINSKEEMETRDGESFRFQITFKAIARMLIKYLPFGRVDENTYVPLLKGNARVFYEIFREWQTLDPRQHRKDILSKPLLIGITVYFFDSDFREVFNYMLSRVIQRQDELRFPPHHLDPGTWTRDDGERTTPGCGVHRIGIVRALPDMIVLKDLLPVRNYWITIEPEKTRYYAINSNHPIWVGDGWGYPLLIDYGDKEEFNRNLLLGDGVHAL